MSVTQNILKVSQRDQDPKESILKAAGDLSGIQVMHNLLLVAIYVAPEKTSGGIIRPQKRIDEDRWQVKSGIVVKKGPLAFVNDAANDFGGQDIDVGAWVAFRGSDGWELTLNNYIFRVLEDGHIKLVLSSPSLITEF